MPTIRLGRCESGARFKMYKVTLLAIFMACGCAGQAQAQSGIADAELGTEDIVVTGTRSAGRAALASSVPVDVASGETIANTGFADLRRALNFLQPSINFARAAHTASAANTKPITLRGLSPDQTLVLVNGKRRHANAVLNVNNSIGRGSAGVDLALLWQIEGTSWNRR